MRKEEGPLIPVKWYMWIMLCAGAIMLLYGLATADPNVVLGSFIFSGMGGLAYYSIRSRTSTATPKNRGVRDSKQDDTSNTPQKTVDAVSGSEELAMNEAARKQAQGLAEVYAKVAKGQLSPHEKELIEELRKAEAEAYAAFRTSNSMRSIQLADVKPSLERLAKDASESVFAAFSSTAFHEHFDDQPMAASWSISDALALWYNLGYFCVLTAAYSRNIDQEAGTAISGATFEALIATWKMSDIVYEKFKAFYRENVNVVWGTYVAIDDAQKLTRFFSLWATRITGGTTPFSPSSISRDGLTNSLAQGELRNPDPILHLALSRQFIQTGLALKRAIASVVA